MGAEHAGHDVRATGMGTVTLSSPAASTAVTGHVYRVNTAPHPHATLS